MGNSKMKYLDWRLQDLVLFTRFVQQHMWNLLGSKLRLEDLDDDDLVDLAKEFWDIQHGED